MTPSPVRSGVADAGNVGWKRDWAGSGMQVRSAGSPATPAFWRPRACEAIVGTRTRTTVTRVTTFVRICVGGGAP